MSACITSYGQSRKLLQKCSNSHSQHEFYSQLVCVRKQRQSQSYPCFIVPNNAIDEAGSWVEIIVHPRKLPFCTATIPSVCMGASTSRCPKLAPHVAHYIHLIEKRMAPTRVLAACKHAWPGFFPRSEPRRFQGFDGRAVKSIFQVGSCSWARHSQRSGKNIRHLRPLSQNQAYTSVDRFERAFCPICIPRQGCN